jgi:hypothetical protein
MKQTKTIYRSAITGKFVPKRYVKNKPKVTVTKRIKKRAK